LVAFVVKLTILGATGGVGRHLVTQALAAGHHVTAVVRDPAKLPSQHQNLNVVRADALDADSIRSAVDGADAVLSAMGANSRNDPLRPASSAATAAVAAMKEAGVRRIIVVSAGTLNRAGVGIPLVIHRVLMPLLWKILEHSYTDQERMEHVLADSGLDWTSVRPPMLTNKPGNGRCRRTIEAGPAGLRISRADLATAMLGFLDDPATIGHTVGVSD
jgi:putative NADH-flavin reductase